jgi:hypothetical protein
VAPATLGAGNVRVQYTPSSAEPLRIVASHASPPPENAMSSAAAAGANDPSGRRRRPASGATQAPFASLTRCVRAACTDVNVPLALTNN